MMIIDPVALGDVGSSRPSPKCVYDKTGTLITVPAGQVAVTYDPSDLSKAPYVVVEAAAINLLKCASQFEAPVWDKLVAGTAVPPIVTPNYAVAPNGKQEARRIVLDPGSGTSGSDIAWIQQSVTSFSDGVGSMWLRTTDGSTQTITFRVGIAAGATQQITVTGIWKRFVLKNMGTGCDRLALIAYGNEGRVRDLLAWCAQLEAGATSSTAWPTDPTFVSRASPGTYYDSSGTLQTAAANVARMTYDPGDLSRPPYLMVENSATNAVTWSQRFGSAPWSSTGVTVADNAATAPDGTTTAAVVTTTGAAARLSAAFLAPAAVCTLSIFFARGNSDVPITQAYGIYNNTTGADLAYALVNYATGSVSMVGPQAANTVAVVRVLTGGWFRLELTFNSGIITGNSLNVYAGGTGGAGSTGETYKVWGAQLEAGSVATSYIPTAGAAVTRAADVVSYNQTRAADSIASGAGLVYSNVAITETAYSTSTTYAAGDQVYDPATYLMYQSLIAANTGHALTEKTAWTPLNKPVNRWQMFDSYNNTQTTNAEEIVVVLSPQAISQGIYLGNVDDTEFRVSVVDLTDGLVYQETQSLIVSDSKSSFYNWFFKRIRRRSYAVSVRLPPYANALITVVLRKPGSTAKCGVCAVGQLVDVGLSQYGLAREIRDFSTINFNFDGTSNQVIRNYAKRMDVDVSIENEVIDSVIENLEALRQKPVAWIGAKEFGSACVFGRYSSFKSVIENYPYSKMNLQIEGTV